MSIFHLDNLFRPKSIAIVGASDRPHSVGNTLVRNLLDGGFEGQVFPVNPKYDRVQGLAAVAHIGDLPAPVDLAIVAIPAAGVPAVVDELGAHGTRAVVIISAGFRETGASGAAIEIELDQIRLKHTGLRILGPNCLGFIHPQRRLNASFAGEMPRPGRVAFVSQSGALCTAILDWAKSLDIGFSLFLSLGNMLDVDFGDTIDYLANDEQTDGLILYVESISHARKFLSAARAFTRRKPIVVYKAGRCPQGAQAAASHTGALAGLDVAYDAAFRRAAIVRVQDSRQLFDCAEMLSRSHLPLGPKLAILTNAGGPGVMATDALAAAGGVLAEISPQSMERLNVLLPPFWSHRNPVDILGDATPDRFAAAAKILVEDDHVNAMIAILTPQAMTEPTETARKLAEAVSKFRKPTLAAWMGGMSVAAGKQILNEHGISTLNTPEEAVSAFLNMAAYAHGLEVLYETPRPASVEMLTNSADRRARVQRLTGAHQGMLDEPTTKALLDVYGIASTTPRPAHSVEELTERAGEIGFPLVMKVLSPDIVHKSDVGGVRTNINSMDEALRVYSEMLQSVTAHAPTARIEGVTVQRYLAPEHKVELILGSRRDPTFGPVIMVGLGGVTTEIFRDCAFELPPLDERLARGMLSRLRIWPLLRGYRGAPALAIDRLIDTLLRYSMLIVECPEFEECDLNPLLVTPDEVTALDARALVRSAASTDARSYAHLAIAPYPDEWIRQIALKDGSRVTVRPIRPEDSPHWHNMVDAASDQSIFARFRSQFRSVVHHDAARYCFIDYDREMAFVVETIQAGEKQLVGIGRLVGDADRDSAEFGALVIDAWQGRGLGGALLDLCLEFAAAAGYRSVYAETGWDNQRMLTLFRKRKFSLAHLSNDATTVRAALEFRH